MGRARVGRFPLLEAQAAKLALEQESIAAELSGEQRSVLQGAVPFSETEVELWVDEAQLERARRLISALLRVNAGEGGERICSACSSVSPANFEVCWSCGAELTSAVQAQVEARPLPSKRSGGAVFSAVFGLTTVILAVMLWQERQQPRLRDTGNMSWEWEPGGLCVLATLNGRRFQRMCDRNEDGTFESSENFDRAGKRLSESFDFDGDEFGNQVNSFDVQGRVVSKSVDTDGDGRFDLFEEFDREERLSNRGMDSDRDGRFERTEVWEGPASLVRVLEGSGEPSWKDTRLVAGGLLVERGPIDGGHAELTVTRDGGVTRVQVLTDDGWDDRR